MYEVVACNADLLLRLKSLVKSDGKKCLENPALCSVISNLFIFLIHNYY